MTSVGAGWLMATLDPNPLMVALVQTATAAPMFLFSLPAGAIADIVDRPKLLITGQSCMCILTALLAVLIWGQWIAALLLLLLVYFLGVSKAFISPAWQAVIPNMVPSKELKQVITLNGIGVNIRCAKTIEDQYRCNIYYLLKATIPPNNFCLTRGGLGDVLKGNSYI